jgi:hypothetical protein
MILSMMRTLRTEGIMHDIKDCGFMELWCEQRAHAEPENAWKWMGLATRWRDLAHPPIEIDQSKGYAPFTLIAGRK